MMDDLLLCESVSDTSALFGNEQIISGFHGAPHAGNRHRHFHVVKGDCVNSAINLASDPRTPNRGQTFRGQIQKNKGLREISEFARIVLFWAALSMARFFFLFWEHAPRCSSF